MPREILGALMGCLFSNATRLELEFFRPMVGSEESGNISIFFFFFPCGVVRNYWHIFVRFVICISLFVR